MNNRQHTSNRFLRISTCLCPLEIIAPHRYESTLIASATEFAQVWLPEQDKGRLFHASLPEN